ncbi:hypothetical protein BG004_008167 [Podila humilis]|nr:hypothetical protein BG004_008167 [Podila humilis]
MSLQQLYQKSAEPGYPIFKLLACLIFHTAYFQAFRYGSEAIRQDKKRLSWILTWIASTFIGTSAVLLILTTARTVFHSPIPYELYDSIHPTTGEVQYHRYDVPFPPPSWIQWPAQDPKFACGNIKNETSSDSIDLDHLDQQWFNCTVQQERQAFYRYVDHIYYGDDRGTTDRALFPRWSFARFFSWLGFPPRLLFDFRFKADASAHAEWTVVLFASYLLADLGLGWIYYREKLTLLTGWGHHLVFIAASYGCLYTDTAIVGASVLAVEVPTAFVAIGFVFKSLRNDMLFGMAFILWRLVFDTFYTHEVLRNWTELAVWLKMVLIVKTIFAYNFFRGWVTQQIKLKGRKHRATIVKEMEADVVDAESKESHAANKAEFYQDLVEQVQAVIEGQRNWVTNLANTSALIYHGLRAVTGKPINWVGFYVLDQDQPTPTIATPKKATLILGPFQGKVACTSIQFGRGVCGTAAEESRTLLVKDVHEFPGHIACDAASNSEIVVPLVLSGRVIGVLDLDCEVVEGFDEVDQAGLEKVTKILVEACDWRGVV